MTTFEFIELFSENFLLYLLIAIPIVIVYIKIAKKITHSWINPVAFIVITAGIGISVACFLYATHNASFNTFLYVIVSSVLFWSILWKWFPSTPSICKVSIVQETTYARMLFVVFYWGNIAMTLFSYSRFGIPIFNDNSRLVTYTDSGGFGVILRLTAYFQIYSIFYIIDMFVSKKTSAFAMSAYLLPLLIFGVLSGSRSSFLNFIFAWWGYNRFYLNKEISIFKYKKLIFIFIGISIFSFALGHSTDLIGGTFSFLTRIIATGDLYWYSLPNDTWADMTITTPVKDILVNFLGPFRLMSEADADIPIGYQLTSLVYPGFDKMTGPVELFPISSLAYFGHIGGLFFTLFQAICACLFFKLFYRTSNSLIISSFMYFAFSKSVDFLASFKNATGQMFDVLLNLCVIIAVCLIFGLIKFLTVEYRISRVHNNNI